MVKNTHGGSGHKKFARKHTGGSKSNKLRISEDEGEVYAIVTKMLGNGMFHCHCMDGTIRLGHIRGKFTGRGKRDNLVETGKWLLIGLREWDIPSEKSSSISKGKEKMQQCDLLEVYNDSDRQRLKETLSEDWYILESNDVSKVKVGEETLDSEIEFGTDRDFERERLIQEMKTTTERIKLRVEENTNGYDTADQEQEQEVNFEDI
jgi:initiation factor 1A